MPKIENLTSKKFTIGVEQLRQSMEKYRLVIPSDEFRISFYGSINGLTNNQKDKIKEILTEYKTKYDNCKFNFRGIIGADSQIFETVRECGWRFVVHSVDNPALSAHLKYESTDIFFKPTNANRSASSMLSATDLKMICLDEFDMKHLDISRPPGSFFEFFVTWDMPFMIIAPSGEVSLHGSKSCKSE